VGGRVWGVGGESGFDGDIVVGGRRS
jgi:hypothetical protein